MARDVMRVDGVPEEARDRLRAEAMRLYGKPNASQLVRSLIADHLAKSKKHQPVAELDFSEKTGRIELTLPISAIAEIEKRAEERFSSRNFYLNSVIFEHLGQPQLQASEIEVLRRSNYEMAKIGTNINQVAKAFNILVKAGGSGKLPEIGKKIASLRKEITEHTRKVLRVLESGTAIFEAQGRGQRRSKKK